MLTVANKKNLVIKGLESNYQLFLKLEENKDEIIFIHPTISLFFDDLTLFKFIHNEILINLRHNSNLPPKIRVNPLDSNQFKIFKSYSLDFEIEINANRFKFKCVSPEFGLIWMLETITSLNVGIALALLEFCDIALLKQFENLIQLKNALNLILEIGETTLNRYDLIWPIIEKYEYKKELSDFPLFLDRNIRIERRYDRQIK